MNTRLGVLLLRCRWAMGEKAALKKAVSLVEKGQKEKAKEPSPWSRKARKKRRKKSSSSSMMRSRKSATPSSSSTKNFFLRTVADERP